MPIIEARDVSKIYPATAGKRALLGRGGIGAWLRKLPPPLPALSDLSLAVEAGESIGIIGRNGSGKSTLLKLIAGVSAPTSGTLEVRGRVASLLELGAGFHPMLTGRENVYLNAGLLGMRHTAVDACFEDILAFSEIGEFIDRTVDTYSSGMYVRLAFAVAVHTNPDIFLVDEVLSVGDESFQRKCRARILELKADGKTILFVSHDLGSVQALCDRVLLLERGEVLTRGSASETITYYLRQIGEASGICRLSHGPVEALFNHGRIALYHRQREITAPSGIKVQFRAMGAYHESADAVWHILESTETTLEAEGTLPRLSVTVRLRVTLDDRGLTIAADWENTQPVTVDYAALQCFLPDGLTRWRYGPASDEFPPITPADRQWTPIAIPRDDCWHCELFDPADSHAPVCIVLDDTGTRGRLQIDNTDFMASARLVHVTDVLPASAGPLPPAQRSLARVTIDPAQTLETIAARNEALEKAQALAFGESEARMVRGGIELRHGGEPLTQGIQLHVQLRTGGLWLMSQDLLWEPAREIDGRRVATGRSMRLPLRMALTMEAAEDALQLGVALELDAELAVEECNVSLGLAPAYDTWETAGESGAFDVHSAGALDEWIFLNRAYTPGSWIRARGAGIPAITLSAENAPDEVLPCAIRTSPTQQASVLQLLCSAGRGDAYTLAPGRHDLFRVRVEIGETP